METDETIFNVWRTSNRQIQLKALGLQEYYNLYYTRLYQGYINTFSIIHIVVNLLHILLLLVFVQKLNFVLLDIGCYTLSIFVVFLPLLYLKFQPDIKKHYITVLLVCFLPLLVLAATDVIVLLPSYANNVRGTHVSYILVSIYIFMPFFQIIHCVYLAFMVTVYYLLVYLFFVYNGDPFVNIKICTEVIFLASINVFGILFRLMRQTAIIEIFFDRWELVKQTIMFKYESDQEKKLLLSIIPANTANDLVTDIVNRIKSAKQSTDPLSMLNNFNLKPDKLYIYFYSDVSILYADVVNYTYLTTTLEVKPLVETLHELFVKFDEAAVEYKCLRIKFLGDCYYCVSGIPEKNPNHAKNCVDLGLNMIQIIRAIRIRIDLDIDMRIGIHSGNVFAGIIGTAKWQYDIWSRDVEIANRLESTGVAGVHVSKHTLSMLNEEYLYEEGPPVAKQDAFLIKNEITETFLIIPSPEEEDGSTTSQQGQQAHTHTAQRAKSGSFLTVLVQQYKQIQDAARKEMSNQFKKTPVPSSILEYIQYKLCNKHLQLESQGPKVMTITLFMKNLKDEQAYWQTADGLLKYSVLTAVFIFICITLVGASNRSMDIMSGVETCIVFAILSFWLFLMWYQTIWKKVWVDTRYGENEYREPNRNSLSNFIYKSYDTLIKTLYWRVIIYLTVIISIQAGSLLTVLDCDEYKANYLDQFGRDYKICFNPWSITHVIVLVRCINFLFVQIPYVCKLLTGVVITAVYAWIVLWKYDYVYNPSYTINVGLDPKYAHLFVAFIGFILLNLMERQTEIFFKTDYTWKKRLNQSRQDTEISKKIAKTLIENILPAHIAEIYMSRKLKNELYTEKYSNVAIMFATIKNYDIEIVGLRVLNKIFSDFDEKLNLFAGPLRIEKIKVVGLTYMAACGLDPGFCEETSIVSKNYKKTRQNIISRWVKVRQLIRKQELKEMVKRPYVNVLIMAKFALELMKTLRKFNMEYYHNEVQSQNEVGVLRIGISHGEVMGGVVGSSKPFYDVWGNTINIASRMDTTGEGGKIQVTEATALVLRSFNIKCDYRGLTYVKGLEYVPTYFVGIDENLQFTPGSRTSLTNSDAEDSQDQEVENK